MQSTFKNMSNKVQTEDQSVTDFREYLRIKSVHPHPDNQGAVDYVLKHGEKLGLKTNTFTCVEGKPLALLTWEGTEPSLPSILLNSHYDVVPAVLESWNYDPFEAYKDENGNIYARGTQDMKSVGSQYLAAIRKLKESNFTPRRTIHLLYVPDEEIGGRDGMGLFVKTKDFADLNVGLALDEGLASPTEEFIVYYGERAPWWVRFKATGPTGHASRFIQNTALDKLLEVIRKAAEFRKEQFDTLQRGEHQCGMKLGDVTTINLTVLKSGVTSDGGKSYSYNVIPTEAEAGFDIRIPPTVNLPDFKKKLEEWASAEGVTFEFYNVPQMENHSSDITEDAKWWNILKKQWESKGMKVDAQIFPAATDSRYIRDLNIPAFGFSPMNHTPTLLHDHNEFLNEKVFLKGVEIYVDTIRTISSTERFEK